MILGYLASLEGNPMDLLGCHSTHLKRSDASAMDSRPIHKAKAVAQATRMPIRVARMAVQRALLGVFLAKSELTKTWEANWKPYSKYLSCNFFMDRWSCNGWRGVMGFNSQTWRRVSRIQSVEYTGVEKREWFIDIQFGHIVPHHSITPRIHVHTFTIKNHEIHVGTVNIPNLHESYVFLDHCYTISQLPFPIAQWQEGKEGFGHAGMGCQRRHSNFRDDATGDQPEAFVLAQRPWDLVEFVGDFAGWFLKFPVDSSWFLEETWPKIW